ncbi:C40 family peptidase [Kineococcus sp. SYSU DK001]|uniref:C40 family peptidase n=1 Tax=Kineococcus sp. SYSU DK001 TaxID=3383122 RepID=UPI003D7EDA60
MRERTTRRTLLLALAASVPLTALAGALAGTAAADPTPSQDEVDAARRAADATAARVDALQAQLNAEQTRLEAARTALSVAAEDYDEARALLARRAAESTAAATAAEEAAAAHERARVALGRLAAEQYRGTSGDYAPLATVLASGSVQDYVDGRATLDHLTAGRADVQREAAAAKARAADTAARSAAAAQAQQDATTAAETARAAAQRAADDADAVVTRTQRQSDDLVAQLAQLQRTSVALEQQRQAGLAAEREAAAAAAARAAAQRASTPAGPSPAGSSVRRAAGPTAGADTAVDFALAQRGKPYLWAGDGPDRFDCSGLTMRAWEAAGVALPHSSRLQYSGQAKVALADLAAGDLVFYATDPSNPSTIHHVGMVVSAGTMVEAPHTGATVRTSSIYRSGLLPFGTRPA